MIFYLDIIFIVLQPTFEKEYNYHLIQFLIQYNITLVLLKKYSLKSFTKNII